MPQMVAAHVVRLAHQQARRLARGRWLDLGRLGRWYQACGRVLTALAGGPLTDDESIRNRRAEMDPGSETGGDARVLLL